MRLRRALFTAVLSTFPLASFLACTGDDPTLARDGDSGGAANDGSPESAPGDDSAADAPVDAGSTWCSSQAAHQFCDDFDRDPFDKLWVRFERMGNVAANVTDFVSAPRSMTGTVSAGSGTSTTPLQGMLGHVLNAAPGSVEASFSMRVRTPTTAFTASDNAVVATVAAGDTDFVFLQYTSTGYVLISGTVTDGGLHVASVSVPPKLDAWVSVRIHVDFKTDNTGVVEVHIDGQPAGRIDSVATLAGAIPPTVSLGLGPTVYQQSPGLVVSYDDVLFDNH